MQPDYITIAGCEVINTNRAIALVNTVTAGEECNQENTGGLPLIECEGCTGLDEWLAQCGSTRTPFNDITAAPWYDPDQIVSTQVRGIVGLGITGTSSSPMGTAKIQETTTGRYREVEIQFAVFAYTSQAASWALNWIAERFNDSACNTGCLDGVDLCAVSYCPQDFDYTYAMRTMSGVKLVDGPTQPELSETFGQSMIFTSTIIVGTASPYLWGQPHSDGVLPMTFNSSTPTTIDLNPDCEPDIADCAIDPDDPVSTLPVPDSGLKDPLWPSAPFAGRTKSFLIPASTFLTETTAVRITAYAGSLPLRNITVSLLRNNLSQPCKKLHDREGSDCDTCSLITIKYVPPRSTGIIDPLRRIRGVECGAENMGNLYTWGPYGSVSTWPYVYCKSAYCVTISAADAMAADAKITVEFIPTYLTA